jgi:hypothetical protein
MTAVPLASGYALLCEGGFVLVTTAVGVADASAWAVGGITAAEATYTVGMGSVGLGYVGTWTGATMISVDLPHPEEYPWPLP